MGQPAAKQGDQIMATDIHMVFVPLPTGGQTVVSLPHVFNGMITSSLSSTVKIMGLPAATVDSMANNSPAHIPTPPGTSFVVPPTNKATITMGSFTVKINGKPAARNGDIARTCNDPAEAPVGQVIAKGTVSIG